MPSTFLIVRFDDLAYSEVYMNIIPFLKNGTPVIAMGLIVVITFYSGCPGEISVKAITALGIVHSGGTPALRVLQFFFGSRR